MALVTNSTNPNEIIAGADVFETLEDGRQILVARKGSPVSREIAEKHGIKELKEEKAEKSADENKSVAEAPENKSAKGGKK